MNQRMPLLFPLAVIRPCPLPFSLMDCAVGVGLNFPFVSVLLAFREFQSFEHFFHVVERVAKRINNPIHLIDGLLNRGRRSGFPLGKRRFRFSRSRSRFSADILSLWWQLRFTANLLRARRRAFG